MVHEQFVKELGNAFEAASTPSFNYRDVRPGQVDEDRRATDGMYSSMASGSSGVYQQTSHASGYRPVQEREVRVETPHAMEVSPPEPDAEQHPVTPAARPVNGSPLPPGAVSDVNYVKQKERERQMVFTHRSSNHVLIVDYEENECYFLKWKTLNKMQRKGRELDPRYFDSKEMKADTFGFP